MDKRKRDHRTPEKRAADCRAWYLRNAAYRKLKSKVYRRQMKADPVQWQIYLAKARAYRAARKFDRHLAKLLAALREHIYIDGEAGRFAIDILEGVRNNFRKIKVYERRVKFPKGDSNENRAMDRVHHAGRFADRLQQD